MANGSSARSAMPSFTAHRRLNRAWRRFPSLRAALAETPKLEICGRSSGKSLISASSLADSAARGPHRRGRGPVPVSDRAHRGGAGQIELAASKAAQETARLVSEAAAGKPSAADRLDILHRDIVAMNERSLATDDRLVDTWRRCMNSVKGLVQQRERDRARIAAEPQPLPIRETAPEPALASVVQPSRLSPRRKPPSRRGGELPSFAMFPSIQPRIWWPQRDAPRRPQQRAQRSATPPAGNRLRPR